MKRFAIIFALCATGAFAQARSATESECFKKFSLSHQWPAFSPIQLKCFDDSSGFQESMYTICSTDQSDFSAVYLKYLDREQKYKDAAAKFHAATGPERNLAFANMLSAQQDWSFFRATLDPHLNTIHQTKYSCFSQN